MEVAAFLKLAVMVSRHPEVTQLLMDTLRIIVVHKYTGGQDSCVVFTGKSRSPQHTRLGSEEI